MTDLLNRSFKTAVFKVNDYSLDSRKFCNQLEKMSKANGVEFHYKNQVAEIIVEVRVLRTSLQSRSLLEMVIKMNC